MLIQAKSAARLLPAAMLAGCLTAVPAVARTGAVAPAVAAPAAAGWAGPVRLSAPGDLAISPRVTIGGRGIAVAVWAQLHGGGADYVVMTSTRPPGGSWTPPVRLSAPGQFAFAPAVAVSPAGGAVVVWSAAGTGGPGLRGQAVMAAVRRSPRQRWSRPVRLSPGGVAGEQARVAMDGHGHATAIWASGGNGPGRIQTATLNLAGGWWSPPVLLATARQRLLDPQIAASPRGDFVAAWKRLTGGAPLGPRGVRAQIAATVRPAGSRSWLPVTALGPELELPGQDSAAPEFPGPQVAIDAAGDAAVSWQGSYRRTAVPEVSLRTAGRRWQKPARLATATGLFPSVAADARGDLTALWEGTGGRVQTASRRMHAPGWSTPRTLFRGNPGIDSFPQLAASPAGETVAAWGGNVIRAAVQRNPAAAWSRPVLLGPGGLAQLASGPQGQAIVVWQQPVRRPAGIVVQAARFSPARPG